ncbi:MAG: nucleotidyltransferase substrate binding protein [Deltaproteobacteria bacterium]|nr:nucleotidyltransferase substrate binding protein [Deltaproteobacteria bacterium]
MNPKHQNSLENFKKAIEALKEALSLPIQTARDRAGVIQSFEFTYEMSWKALKRYLEHAGHEAQTARDAFRKAYSLGFIEDEQAWLGMIEDRNLTSHTYDQEIADEVIARVRGYVPCYEKLLKNIGPLS